MCYLSVLFGCNIYVCVIRVRYSKLVICVCASCVMYMCVLFERVIQVCYPNVLFKCVIQVGLYVLAKDICFLIVPAEIFLTMGDLMYIFNFLIYLTVC